MQVCTTTPGLEFQPLKEQIFLSWDFFSVQIQLLTQWVDACFPRGQHLQQRQKHGKTSWLPLRTWLNRSVFEAMTSLRKSRISKLLVGPGLLPQEEEEPETVYLQCWRDLLRPTLFISKSQEQTEV